MPWVSTSQIGDGVVHAHLSAISAENCLHIPSNDIRYLRDMSTLQKRRTVVIPPDRYLPNRLEVASPLRFLGGEEPHIVVRKTLSRLPKTYQYIPGLVMWPSSRWWVEVLHLYRLSPCAGGKIPSGIMNLHRRTSHLEPGKVSGGASETVGYARQRVRRRSAVNPLVRLWGLYPEVRTPSRDTCRGCRD